MHIVAIGDGQFLYQILNFLAMLTSDGVMHKLALLGGLLGIVFLSFQTIINNGRDLPIVQVFVGALLFLVFFGKTTTVVVEDYYSGRTRVVDNVPLGTAAIGSIVSQLGIGLTEKFQQASAVPGVESLPYNYVLDALMASRDLTDGSLFKDADTVAFARTTQEYIANCAMQVFRANGNRWPDNRDPTTAEDAFAALRSNSRAFTMQNYMADGEAYMTCADGWTMLNNYMQTPRFRSALDSIVKKNLHRDIGSDSSIESIYNRVFAMVDQTATDSQLWLKNSVVSNLARKAVQSDVGKNDVASALILESSVNQRNIQFATESSMWLRMARGLMTFFEGVAYGSAPFAAFLIPMGAVGLKLGGRYLAVLLWIFLWTPLLSFVNLFTIDALSGQLDALQTVGSAPLHSIVGIMEAQYTAMDYIGLSGWLAPTVASLAGLFVFGGMAAFSGLASRATGGDFVNEGQVAPNALKTGEMVSRAPQMTASPGEGAYGSGAPYHSWSWSEVSQTSESLRQSQSAGAYQEFAQSLKESLRSGASTSETFNQAAGLLQSARASSSEGVSTSTDAGTGYRSGKSGETSFSAGQTFSVDERMNAGLNVGPKTPAGSASAGAGVSTTDQSSERSGTAMSSSVSAEQSRSTGLSDRRSAENAVDLAKSLATGTATAAQLGVSADKAKELTAAARKAWQSTEAYESSVSMSQSHDARLTIGEQQASAALAGSSSFGSVVASASDLAGSHYHQRLDAMNHVGESGQPKYATDEQRQAAAAILALGDAAADTSLPAETRATAAAMQAEALSLAAGGTPMGGSASGIDGGRAFGAAIAQQAELAAASTMAAGSITGPGGSVDGVFGSAQGAIAGGHAAYAGANVAAGYESAAGGVRAAGDASADAVQSDGYAASLASRAEALGIADSYRGFIASALNTAQGGMEVSQLDDQLQAFTPAGVGERIGNEWVTGEAMSHTQVAQREAMIHGTEASAARSAYGAYQDLAAYSALASATPEIRASAGITDGAFAAMGQGLSARYGAENIAMVTSMAEAGFEGRPEFAKTAGMIVQSLESRGVEPLIR